MSLLQIVRLQCLHRWLTGLGAAPAGGAVRVALEVVHALHVLRRGQAYWPHEI